jgi:uncharacterized protein YuzE
MSITVGSYEFDKLRYDSDCDVLCLCRGDSRGRAADTFETPEGHLVFLDEVGEVTGIALISAKELLDRDGKVPVTLPRVVEADVDELAQALAG